MVTSYKQLTKTTSRNSQAVRHHIYRIKVDPISAKAIVANATLCLVAEPWNRVGEDGG